jgi:hypothetical protein
LPQRYQGYKQDQARGQPELREQVREEAKDWKLDLAEQHLAAARNMAYAPDEIRVAERLIADNGTAKPLPGDVWMTSDKRGLVCAGLSSSSGHSVGVCPTPSGRRRRGAWRPAAPAA